MDHRLDFACFEHGLDNRKRHVAKTRMEAKELNLGCRERHNRVHNCREQIRRSNSVISKVRRHLGHRRGINGGDTCGHDKQGNAKKIGIDIMEICLEG